MIEITDKERALLVAIRDCEYQSGDAREDVVGHSVWSFSPCNAFGASAGGIMSSLTKKGLAVSEDYDGEAICWVTEAGFDAVADVPKSQSNTGSFATSIVVVGGPRPSTRKG